MSLLAQGAEARIEKRGEVVIKDRVTKGYRFPALDEKLRKARTKKEAKLLEKATKIISVPKIVAQERYILTLELIKGKKLSQHLDKISNYETVCKLIGNAIAKLHDANIIHGDLTTSNMMYQDKSNKKMRYNKTQNQSIINKSYNQRIANNNSSAQVCFIDFGLGFESSKPEDKATDLHVLKEALAAKHFTIVEKAWKAVVRGYKVSKHASLVLKRLEAVEKRGRYKEQY